MINENGDRKSHSLKQYEWSIYFKLNGGHKTTSFPYTNKINNLSKEKTSPHSNIRLINHPNTFCQMAAAAAADDRHQPGQSPRLIILHRLPNFNVPFILRLRATYTVLDPHADPTDPSFPALSKAARLMVCLGPTPVNADVLDRYPAVECVVCSSAGKNHFDLAACCRRGVRVTGAGESFSDDVADYAVGLAIDVLRRVSAADRFVRVGFWPAQIEYALGSRVCIFPNDPFSAFLHLNIYINRVYCQKLFQCFAPSIKRFFFLS